MKMIVAGAILICAMGLAACNQNNPGTAGTANSSTQRSSAVGNSSAGSNATGDDGAGEPTARTAGADATNQNFTLNNRSQDTITHVYVSSVSDERWGEDVLGSSQVVAPGGTAQITFPRGETECNWDVRVTINNERNHELRNLNLCETTEVNYQ